MVDDVILIVVFIVVHLNAESCGWEYSTHFTSGFALETRSSNWVFKILQDNSKLLEQVGMQKAILQMMDSSQFAIAKVQITKDIIY